jgi:hypothetical protein
VAVRTTDLTASTNDGPFDNTWSGEDIKILIREIVVRFCERTQNSGLCLRFGKANEDFQTKVDTWTVTRKTGNMITVTYPVDGGITVPDFLTVVFSDDYAPSGFGFINVVNMGDTNPTIIRAPPTGHANSLQLFEFLFALAIFVALNI